MTSMFTDAGAEQSQGSDGGSTAHDYPDGGQKGGAQPLATSYEVVGGVDRNLRQPDAETSNRNRDAEAAEAGSELGDPGGGSGGEGDEAVALDAIYGSYPELLNLAEVVIGSDDRTRVQNTAIYPWRAICALRIQAANGARYIGTGWLVSPRTVITAGHCAYMHDAGGWVRSIEVIPGMNDSARPYGSHVGTLFNSVEGWTKNKNREFDYAAIILPAGNRPGVQTGTFGFAVRDDNFIRNAALNLSGYPGDRGAGAQQWFHAQRTKSVSSRVITYDIDTAGGQSGSPVWVLQNGQRYALGVHTNGASSGNSATRITQGVFDNLLRWKNQGA